MRKYINGQDSSLISSRQWQSIETRLIDHGYSITEACKDVLPNKIALIFSEQKNTPDTHALWGLSRLWQALMSAGGFSSLLILSLLSAPLSPPFIVSAYLGFALNNIIYSGELKLFYLLTGLTVLALTMGSILEYLTNKTAAAANSRMCHHLIHSRWSHLMHVSLAVFNRQNKNQLASRFTDAIETLQKHQLYILQNLLRSIFIILITIGILLSYHYAFLLIILPFLCITCLLPIWLAQKADDYIQKEPEYFGQINSFIESVVATHLLLRFRSIKGVQKRFQEILQKMAVNQAGKWLIWNFSFNLKITLNLLSFSCILLLGGKLYFQNIISMEELIIVYILVTMIIPKLDNIYKIYNYTQSLTVNYGEFDAISALPARPVSTPSTSAIKIQDIQLKCVEFRHSPSTPILLANVDIRLERGKKYLITGGSGSGKSTLLDLIMASLSPNDGQLLVNGQEILAHKRPQYWQRIALHDQNNMILNYRSIKFNIELSKNSLRRDRLEKASRALDFNHWGAKNIDQLSDGERQRMCFLRAYACPADVLIFDEPTSALDPQKEQAALQLLGELKDDIVIVISHNSEFIPHFDSIIEVKNGTAKLLSTDGVSQ